MSQQTEHAEQTGRSPDPSQRTPGADAPAEITPGLVPRDPEAPRAPDPNRPTGGRAEAFILADGSEVTIDPRAEFADTIVEAYGNYLNYASGRPLEVIKAEVETDHLEWTPEQIKDETKRRAREERARAGATHFREVIGKSSIHFQLAALALGGNMAWARIALYPDEAQKVVQRGCELAGMEEYISKSLTFPVTTVSPETAAEIKKAQKDAEAEARQEIEEELADLTGEGTPQGDSSPGEPEPSSPGSTDSEAEDTSS